MSKSILVVTVTKLETQATLKAFSAEPHLARQVIGNKTYYQLGVHGDAPILLVQSEMGTATPGGALLTVRQAIQDLDPQAVIMCGIAFGLKPEKQHLGDILVSKQLQYYEPQKMSPQHDRLFRGDSVTASERLLDRFRSGDLEWNGAWVHFGTVLSGEKLVNRPEFRSWLLEIEPEAIGGEMEGAGLYAAARDAKVDWILVKAICDWADGTKNDAAQPQAAANAAQFVQHVIQLGGWDGSEQSRGQASLKSADPSARDKVLAVETPSPHSPIYSVPRDYTLREDFVGREVELNRLREWAHSKNTIMVVTAMGGMGKSALTWEWAKKHAPVHLAPVGIVWFSFYEKGATLEAFVRHALAYVTGTDYEDLPSMSFEKAARQLIQRLQQRRFLIILDGLERVLIAYHRLDSAHLREQDIQAESEMRRCIEHRDDDFLLQLTACAPSKVLISTRLLPSIFEDHVDMIPSVEELQITGLQPADAAQLAARSGIQQASDKSLNEFLAQFGYHPLMIEIVAGQVKRHRFAPGDFDHWLDNVGQHLKLSQIDNDYRKVTQVLRQSTQDLTRERQRALAMLAVFGSAIDAHLLFEELNPYLPPKMEALDLPVIPPARQNPLGSRRLAELKRQLGNVKRSDSEAIARLQKQIEDQTQHDESEARSMSANVQRLKAERQRAIARRLKKLAEYKATPEYREGLDNLDRDLNDLIARRLVDVTTQAGENVYDLHPLVRAHVTDAEGGFDNSIVDAARRWVLGELSKRSPKDLETLKIECAKHIELGEFDEALQIYMTYLSDPLYKTGRYHDMIRLIIPLFGGDPEELPRVSKLKDRVRLIEELAACLARTGHYEMAARLFSTALPLRIEQAGASEIIRVLTWLAEISLENGDFRYADQINQLALETAQQIGTPAAVYNVYEGILKCAVLTGRWDAADRALTKIDEIEADPDSLRTIEPSMPALVRVSAIQYALLRGLDPAKYLGAQRGFERVGYMTQVKINYLRALFDFDRGDLEQALKTVNDTIRQASVAGIPAASYLGLRAEILSAQGAQREAQSAVQAALRAVDACGIVDKANAYCSAARIAIQTNDTDAAIRFAHQAFAVACADGAPFVYWRGLSEAETVLNQLGRPIPPVPEINLQEAVAVPYEEDIRKLSRQITQEKPKVSNRLLKIKNIAWFQLGVMACFAVTNQDDAAKMELLARELYALSDDPGPIESTTSDQLVNPNPHFSYEEGCIQRKLVEELDLKFLRQAARHDTVLIVFIAATTEEDKLAYFFASVRSEKILGLYQQGQSGELFDVLDYAIRVVYGPFDAPPTEDDLDSMFDTWLFCPYFLPLKLYKR